jgi:hypothetical protein
MLGFGRYLRGEVRIIKPGKRGGETLHTLLSKRCFLTKLEVVLQVLQMLPILLENMGILGRVVQTARFLTRLLLEKMDPKKIPRRVRRKNTERCAQECTRRTCSTRKEIQF